MFKRLTMLFFLSLLLVGCGTSNDKNIDDNHTSGANGDEPGMIGYVVDKDHGRILVVDSEPQDFSSTGGVSEYYNAIYFSNVPEEVEIGDKVKVWFDIVAESYPGQSSATKIEVLLPDKYDGATFTSREAIKQALQKVENDDFGIKVVKDVQFKDGIWTVIIKKGEEDYTIEIADGKRAETENPSTGDVIPELQVGELSKELQARLYQEIDETNYKVKNFTSKQELIHHLGEIAEIEYAKQLVDEFYEEKDGELYVIPRGGRPFVLDDKPYETIPVSDNEIIVKQEMEDELHGHYIIEVTFVFDGEKWKIKNDNIQIK